MSSLWTSSNCGTWSTSHQEVWASRFNRDLLQIWWQEASCGHCVVVCMEMAMVFFFFFPASVLHQAWERGVFSLETVHWI